MNFTDYIKSNHPDPDDLLWTREDGEVMVSLDRITELAEQYKKAGEDLINARKFLKEQGISDDIDFEELGVKISPLLYKIPKEQIKRVFEQRYCDIDYEFLGFTDIYERLSAIIPKHFTVIDLGCAYNPQCFYFTEHKQYVAVDISDCEKFQSENCTIHQKTIKDFIAENLKNYDLEETFAICSYVPPWGGDNCKMVREVFKNLFVYYPHGGYKELFKYKRFIDQRYIAK